MSALAHIRLAHGPHYCKLWRYDRIFFTSFLAHGLRQRMLFLLLEGRALILTPLYSRLHGTIPKTGSDEVTLNNLRISVCLTSRSLFDSGKEWQPRDIDLEWLQVPIARFPYCFMTKNVNR